MYPFPERSDEWKVDRKRVVFAISIKLYPSGGGTGEAELIAVCPQTVLKGRAMENKELVCQLQQINRDSLSQQSYAILAPAVEGSVPLSFTYMS